MKTNEEWRRKDEEGRMKNEGWSDEICAIIVSLIT